MTIGPTSKLVCKPRAPWKDDEPVRALSAAGVAGKFAMGCPVATAWRG